MKQYYSVGHGESCGHRHRTRSGAERCARSFLWSNRDDLKQEAEEHTTSLRKYIDSIIAEDTGDCLINRITEQK